MKGGDWRASAPEEEAGEEVPTTPDARSKPETRVGLEILRRVNEASITVPEGSTDATFGIDRRPEELVAPIESRGCSGEGAGLVGQNP